MKQTLSENPRTAAGLYLGFGGWCNLTSKNFFINGEMDGLSRLHIISNHGVGYDNVEASTAAKYNIIVTNTPEVVSAATAEIAMALMLNCLRKLNQQEASLRRMEWSQRLLFGNDLRGKTLGIVGLGSIGQQVAKRARAFDMNVVYYQRTRHDEQFEKEHGVAYAPSLKDLLNCSDIISLHCPLTPNTRHLIGEEQFQEMKQSAYIINTSRGPVIDEKALLMALREERIAGAGLDVHEFEPKITEEFLQYDNVVMLPHVGTHTMETRLAMESLCLENLRRVLVEGKDPVTPVKECEHISVREEEQ